MHKEIRFTKQELLDILDGKVIEARDVDGVLHRFMISESKEESRYFKIYYDLYSKNTNTKIISVSQIVKANSVEEAVNEIKQKRLYRTLKIGIAVNKIEERKF
ncbi:hypothetical protein QNJ28_00540 [Macrococcus caseolyticus]|uniref:hypothetical protein n=1 Tax=Macrococcoides caseolyticum TaxID=69966 RepID=UPI0024BD3A33|nr:hypothetical protein [Macrococcus caseolyticus]MDJ1108573.1 hypothetical protein [Macrococcus caseolyticus]